MDVAMGWLALVSAAAAVSSAVFAFVQAKAATDSRKDADAARDEARVARDESAQLAREANAAFVRQASAQEEANRLKAAELAPRDWSMPTLTGGSRYTVTNTSGRTLIVDRFGVDPSAARDRIRLRGEEGNRYEYGHSFSFFTMRAAGPNNPKRLLVTYHSEDDPTERDYIVALS